MTTKAIILTLAIYCLSVINCAPNDEVAAEVFVKDSSDKLYDITNEITDVAYNALHFETTNDGSSEESNEIGMATQLLTLLFKLGQLEQAATKIKEYSDEAAKFKYNEFNNPELKMALQHIHLTPGNMALDSESEDAEDALTAIKSKKNICSFKNKANCDLSFAEDVSEVIRKTNNPEELKYYWNEWRSKNQENFKESLNKVIELHKKASEHYKVSPSMYWFRTYYDEHFIDEMEKVVTEIQPLYQKLHAFVRSILIKQYGADGMPEDESIPAHLFEKVLADAWSNKGMFSNLITKHNLVNMKKILKEKNVTARKLVDFADDFFKKMGLDELPKDFWEARVKELEDDEKDDLECLASVFDISRKPYLKYCPDVDMRKFLQMHGWMARIYYANEKKNLPFAFFESYELEYPVGEAAILSAMSAKHMDSLGLTKDTKYADDDFEMARLMHLSIHTVLKIPMYYVHARIMNDLISDNVKLDNVNTHYWTLIKKYAGVSSPAPIKGDEITFPYSFYNKLDDNYQTNKFVSEIMGYQMYESLCKKSGHNTDLHKCDFSTSTEAGKTLKEMMSMGSKKPWREVLSVVTGTDTGMSAKSIMHYFAPLEKWIQEQNTK